MQPRYSAAKRGAMLRYAVGSDIPGAGCGSLARLFRSLARSSAIPIATQRSTLKVVYTSEEGEGHDHIDFPWLQKVPSS